MKRQEITQERKDIASAFTLKRVVEGRGHDMGGLIADVYFKKKMVAEFCDDGWGGEPEIRFSSVEAEEKVRQYFIENDYGQKMFDNGWEFMKTVESIDYITQFTDVVELTASMLQENKQLKKIARACAKGIVYGTAFHYQELGWKGVRKLGEVLTYKGGKEALQGAYDKAKESGKEIFNDLEVLKTLGVKL